MSEEIPKRDVTEETDVTEENETTSSRIAWKEFKNVKESSLIDTVDRLQIVAGVNEYKGNHYVFIAKVTDKDFQRSFFSLPAYVWQKAIPVIQDYTQRIAEIEKKAMEQQVLEELKRLKEMGIDVKALAQQL
jgi:hypothetical protein